MNLKVLKVKDVLIQKKDGLFSDKTFMFTGKLKGISRAEAKSLIEENSGSIVSNVSKTELFNYQGKTNKKKLKWLKI